jgi:D-sedoheptulose 7-phosphate isomerase
VTGIPCGYSHLAALRTALDGFGPAAELADRWGRRLAVLLPRGARLLVCGNGGSAAQAQHLTAELVGRYRDDRLPYSALALHTDTSAVTAICNDYGAEELFARQVSGHGRAGDILMLLSTSGSSANLLRAAARGRERGMRTWAMTGPLPNPLAAACDEVAGVQATDACTVQELHLVAVHILCAGFDVALGVSTPRVDTHRLPTLARDAAPARDAALARDVAP